MRKLKYMLDRDTLSKIYLVFIRPHLEYACELWDGCSIELTDKIEKVQFEAARIVTGLPRYASRDSLLFETEWQLLKDRRTCRKLSLFYKIYNKNAPSYLCDLMPEPVEARTNYNLRNTRDLSLSNYRTSLYGQSFFPSTSQLWNNIPLHIRESTSLKSFKSRITTRNLKAPPYYSFGSRKLNIIHTQLRYSNSKLNADLNKYGIVDSSECKCKYRYEDSQHYFMNCMLYDNIRHELFQNINKICKSREAPNVNLLLHGNADLPSKDNIEIFRAVQSYILKSHRFTD